MSRRRAVFLAKLGIMESTNELGEYNIQRIDDPRVYEYDLGLNFTPEKLESDEEAKRIFNTLTHEQLLRLEQPTQLELQHKIVEELGINIVTCGSCGSTLLVEMIDEDIECPDCGMIGDHSDFPDLNY